MRPLWIFGYGSLMWRPGFAHAERRHGYLEGFRPACPWRAALRAIEGVADDPVFALESALNSLIND